MKWIKASADKLQHYQKVFVRKIGHEGGGFAMWDGIRKVFINDHLFGPRGGDPKDFEWLDESQPSSDQIAGMRKDMDMALEREKELIAALDQAVILIRRWHDMYDQKSDKVTLEQIWGIYYSKSPEMKIIRKACASYKQFPLTGGEQDEWKSVQKDGYPEHNVGLLVFIPEEDYHITSGMWDISNKWVLLDDYRVSDSEVTHWMPIPQIPSMFIKEREGQFEAMKEFSKMLKQSLRDKKIQDWKKGGGDGVI